MGDETALPVVDNDQTHGSNVLDIYPLGCYYFGSTRALPFKDETLSDRLHRLKSNYAAHGMRTCVKAVILVELFKHPHLLLLQVRNSLFELPGGRLRPSESEVDCLKRKLSSKLSVDEEGSVLEWEVGECIGMWWRPDFETLMYPYLPPNVKRPKECTKLFLVKLPESRKFIVPRNYKLLAVPLCQIHENNKGVRVPVPCGTSAVETQERRHEASGEVWSRWMPSFEGWPEDLKISFKLYRYTLACQEGSE